ncbi:MULTISPECIES: F0F1 ATP synthase subunit A [unclassified Adlercreutzia]|uniref:F0F1 ATP synthase subunit A n=1 Tax=unclassified Adlercreutzia TaxID=2636013 RepID=UPI0013EBF8B9|nr:MULTISPECIES: F0F1 ATP synthase subunit A [unclassified Adlercreutzia]
MAFELTGNPLADIAGPIEELSESFNSTFVVDFGNGFGITQYTVWMCIICVIVLAVVLAGVRKVDIAPKGKFAGLIDWGYDAICRNMGEGAIGHGYKKHIPFLATLFFFIFISNVIGLIPGTKTPTGSLSVTWALALVSFIYFNFYGIKAKGGLGYLKSIAPSGLPVVMVPIIWFFEFFSLVVRLLTLAVRLYGNMFAGHVILGVFAIMTQFFILDLINFANPVGVASIAWFAFLFIMYVLECLVAFLQAYVFTILSAVYVGLATSEH